MIETIPDAPIVLVNHPKKGTIIQDRTGRYNTDISETKDCAECQHLKAITSSQKTGYKLTEEHLMEIMGVCTWSTWKIVWRRDNPKKCVKLSAFFEKQFREQA